MCFSFLEILLSILLFHFILPPFSLNQSHSDITCFTEAILLFFQLQQEEPYTFVSCRRPLSFSNALGSVYFTWFSHFFYIPRVAFFSLYSSLNMVVSSQIQDLPLVVLSVHTECSVNTLLWIHVVVGKEMCILPSPISSLILFYWSGILFHPIAWFPGSLNWYCTWKITVFACSAISCICPHLKDIFHRMHQASKRSLCFLLTFWA